MVVVVGGADEKRKLLKARSYAGCTHRGREKEIEIDPIKYIYLMNDEFDWFSNAARQPNRTSVSFTVGRARAVVEESEKDMYMGSENKDAIVI